ncbi:MAG: STAS domain-containing protein [Candidatus Krumholzibacteriota bacterium]|nr:STAS domain-containing protein [Candidatus Krumholzibacteriota bacterium]
MDKLNILEERLDDLVILKLEGLVDSGTSGLLEDRFRELIKRGNVRLIVDLQEVNYISSAGWGIFIGEIKGVRQKKGDIKLCGMRPEVREVFDLLEFNALLKPYNSNKDAMVDFGVNEKSERT